MRRTVLALFWLALYGLWLAWGRGVGLTFE